MCVQLDVYMCMSIIAYYVHCVCVGVGLDRICLLCPLKNPKSRNYLKQNRWQREIPRRTDRISWGRKAMRGVEEMHAHSRHTYTKKTDSQQSGDPPQKSKIQSLLQAGGF